MVLELEQLIVGVDDTNIKAIEEKFKVELRVSQGEVSINKDTVDFDKENLVLRRIKCIFEAMELLLENKIILNDIDFYSLISNIDSDNYKSIVSLYLDKEVLFNTVSGKAVYPKTLNHHKDA